MVDMWWSIVQSLPEPSRLEGNITVWKGMLSLPMNWKSSTLVGALPPVFPVEARLVAGAGSYRIYNLSGASNQT